MWHSSVRVRRSSVLVRHGSVRVRHSSVMVWRSSVGSAPACCKSLGRPEFDSRPCGPALHLMEVGVPLAEENR